MNKINYCIIALLILVSTLPLISTAQQVPDTGYDFQIVKPQYTKGRGPVISFDEHHNNVHTLKGTYYTFNKVLSNDGYILRPIRNEITAAVLGDTKIYVTANAIYSPMDWDHPATSVFSDKEINAIHQWVEKGGSLFIITDHKALSGSVNALAKKFGFNLIDGFAIRKDDRPEIFSLRRNNLKSSTITNVLGAKIDSIRIWGGTGFTAPREAEIISSLGEDYNIYIPVKVSDVDRPILESTPRVSGLNYANGAILKYGKGRIVLFGEGAAFAAQLEGITSLKRGMNHPDAQQNAQFLLNIIHWLDGAL